LAENTPFLDRRTFLRWSGGAFAARALAVRGSAWRGPWLPAPEPGRLSTRFHKPSGDAPFLPGEHVLAANGDRRSILFVPSSFDAKRPAPFYVALHGATGSGDTMLRGTRVAAEAHGVVVLSPSSRDFSWDAIRGDYAEDFALVDKLINQVFDRCSIDPRRVAIAGFSDGATYALSVGLLNGDLFTHVIAHSPGFIISSGAARGKPRVFISHGREDTILPFDQCGRRLASQLEHDGYRVRFDAFDGGHTATPAMRETAMSWFVG
jgi:phospholipase/carboxylesterase